MRFSTFLELVFSPISTSFTSFLLCIKLTDDLVVAMTLGTSLLDITVCAAVVSPPYLFHELVVMGIGVVVVSSYLVHLVVLAVVGSTLVHF